MINRRQFLSALTALSVSSYFGNALFAMRKRKTIRFGIVTDVHYADIDSSGTRYYRKSLEKLRRFVDVMNEEEVDFVIELGDFKDQSSPPTKEETLAYLKTIENEFQRCKMPRYHVLGNHDTDCLLKDDFLDGVVNEGYVDAFPYYSFTKRGIHFVVLDSTYRKDGESYNDGNFDWREAYINEEQLHWLRNDLARYRKPTVVFLHHPLVVPKEGEEHMCLANAKEVNEILENSGQVISVFSGHFHEGHIEERGDALHYTLKSLVDGNDVEKANFGIVTIDLFQGVSVKGFGEVDDYSWLLK